MPHSNESVLTQKEPVRCTNKLIKKTTDTKRVRVNAPLDSACAELVTTDSTTLCCYDILLCPRYWQANYSVVTVSVCLSVREHISGTTRPIFTKALGMCTLDPALAALRYIMYFRFTDDVIFAHNGPHSVAPV